MTCMPENWPAPGMFALFPFCTAHRPRPARRPYLWRWHPLEVCEPPYHRLDCGGECTEGGASR